MRWVRPCSFPPTGFDTQRSEATTMVVNTYLVNRVITVGRVKNPTFPCCMGQEERGKHPFLAQPTYDASSPRRCVLLFLMSFVSRSSSGYSWCVCSFLTFPYKPWCVLTPLHRVGSPACKTSFRAVTSFILVSSTLRIHRWVSVHLTITQGGFLE
jgi:hypothetical protein